MVIHITKADGHTTDGRTLDECLAYLPNGEYVATVEPKSQWEKRQPRSLNQNALIHVWFKHLAKAFNAEYGDDYWTADKVKEYFADLFGQDEITPDGKVWRRPLSTSELNKRQMYEYMERIQAHVAVENGITVPLPDDDKFAEFQMVYG